MTPQHRPGDRLGYSVGRPDAQLAGDETSGRLMPAGVHRHRVSLQFRGLQDDPHALTLQDCLGLVEGSEGQQRRAQCVVQWNPRIKLC